MEQSKADRAKPVLENLLACADEPLVVRAEAAQLMAAAVGLLVSDLGELHLDAAANALALARESEGPELIARALFEYAKSGAEGGDERRVGLALEALEKMDPLASEHISGFLEYAKGFCHYFFYDAEQSALHLHRALSLLSRPTDSVVMSFAFNGYGLAHQAMCRFDEAYNAFLSGLELSITMGDDSRASVITSNLCALFMTFGRDKEAVEYGMESVGYGAQVIAHPRMLGARMNLCEALLLSGDRVGALEQLELARARLEFERSWRVQVVYLSESANLALALGDESLALKQIANLIMTIGTRQRAIPDPGIVSRLTTYFVARTEGFQDALALADSWARRFVDRNPLYYFDAIVVKSWIERSMSGHCAEATAAALESVMALGLSGRVREVQLQGFLE
jgi:tetratricopeptide (TPR) repeat protein